jgi:hypothetical protein
LCNWLVPNKKKKTCPECRELVKEAPAPSFLASLNPFHSQGISIDRL